MWDCELLPQMWTSPFPLISSLYCTFFGRVFPIHALFYSQTTIKVRFFYRFYCIVRERLLPPPLFAPRIASTMREEKSHNNKNKTESSLLFLIRVSKRSPKQLVKIFIFSFICLSRNCIKWPSNLFHVILLLHLFFLECCWYYFSFSLSLSHSLCRCRKIISS
jgi:hypothetical protein